VFFFCRTRTLVTQPTSRNLFILCTSFHLTQRQGPFQPSHAPTFCGPTIFHPFLVTIVCFSSGSQLSCFLWVCSSHFPSVILFLTFFLSTNPQSCFLLSGRGTFPIDSVWCFYLITLCLSLHHASFIGPSPFTFFSSPLKVYFFLPLLSFHCIFPTVSSFIFCYLQRWNGFFNDPLSLFLPLPSPFFCCCYMSLPQ